MLTRAKITLLPTIVCQFPFKRISAYLSFRFPIVERTRNCNCRFDRGWGRGELAKEEGFIRLAFRFLEYGPKSFLLLLFIVSTIYLQLLPFKYFFFTNKTPVYRLLSQLHQYTRGGFQVVAFWKHLQNGDCLILKAKFANLDKCPLAIGLQGVIRACLQWTWDEGPAAV